VPPKRAQSPHGRFTCVGRLFERILEITMTDKDVERVKEALDWLVYEEVEGRDAWLDDLARVACAAYESAVTDIAKLGTVSLTSFDGHCVRIDFPNREDAERMYAVLTEGSK
jgi:hypothetical protein